jgi:hypothetical protein
MQQLTSLTFGGSNFGPAESYPPASAYAALTASSNLQHLDISNSQINDPILPAGVFRHMFPAGRRLPHLQTLNIARARHPTAGTATVPATAPEGTALVSCCPALQYLDMRGLQHSSELLGPLQQLRNLRTLYLRPGVFGTWEGWEGVCHLTGLRQLNLDLKGDTKGLLLKLTQLQQLTSLHFMERVDGMDRRCDLPRK